MRFLYIPTYLLFALCALLFVACEKSEDTLVLNEDGEVSFRDERQKKFRTLNEKEIADFRGHGDQSGPTPDLPEGTLGCWKGTWEGYYGPNLITGGPIYNITMQYHGTYHANLDGTDGNWQIEDGPGGHFQVYTYNPYGPGSTASLFLRLMEPDGTVWADGPWFGELNSSCDIIDGPTYVGTEPTGYYYLTKN